MNPKIVTLYRLHLYPAKGLEFEVDHATSAHTDTYIRVSIFEQHHNTNDFLVTHTAPVSLYAEYQQTSLDRLVWNTMVNQSLVGAVSTQVLYHLAAQVFQRQTDWIDAFSGLRESMWFQSYIQPYLQEQAK